MFDKLKFWKGDDDFSDDAFSAPDPLKDAGKDPLQQQDPLAGQQDPLQQSTDFSQGPLQDSESFDQQYGSQEQYPQRQMMQQGYDQEKQPSWNDDARSGLSQPSSTQSYDQQYSPRDRDLELINAKLDAINAKLDHVHQRLQKIEGDKKRYW